MEISTLEKSIINILNQYGVDSYSKQITSDKYWTNNWKIVLGELGRREDYLICASGITGAAEEYHGEWLFDMVWYKEGDKFTTLELAIECEWSLNFAAIRYDFEKLLVTNAKHRLMMCTTWQVNMDDLVDLLYKSVNDYEQSHNGDRYLLAILNRNSNKFFEVYLFVKNEGKFKIQSSH